jgi:hypothetical protein
VEWWIARFSLERALSLPTGESRIAAFLQAAQALAPFDEALATEALVGALRDSALYDANLGWAERAHSLAEAGGIPYAATVASVLDPKVRARSLIAAGMTADEDIALIDDAWARAEIRVRAAAKDPGPDQVDEALVAVRDQGRQPDCRARCRRALVLARIRATGSGSDSPGGLPGGGQTGELGPRA